MKNLIIFTMIAFLNTNIMAAHFNTGSSVPTEELKEELTLLYNEKIKDHEVYEVIVEGHTDSRGNSVYNNKLSEKRAKAAYNYLVKLGLKSKKSLILGKGGSSLVSLGSTLLDHSKNRRVIVIVKSNKGTTKTIISECKEKVVIKKVIVKEKVFKKNAVKLFLGYGPNDLKKGNNRADLDKDPFVGVGYQRMLNEEFSVEAIGTTNESIMIGGGFHF